MEKVRLAVPDLDCASCVDDIERTLRTRTGVIWASVSFAARELVIVYDPSTFDLLGLVQSLEQLGLHSRLSDVQQPVAGRLPARQIRRVEQWMVAH